MIELEELSLDEVSEYLSYWRGILQDAENMVEIYNGELTRRAQESE